MNPNSETISDKLHSLEVSINSLIEVLDGAGLSAVGPADSGPAASTASAENIVASIGEKLDDATANVQGLHERMKRLIGQLA